MPPCLGKPHDTSQKAWANKLVVLLVGGWDGAHRRYERLLHGTLDWVPVTAVFALVVLGSIYFLYATAKSELAPPEDQGIIISASQAAPNSTLQQRQLYTRVVY